MIEFAVTDTGIGIAAEHLPALFSDFVQIDTRIQKRLRGTGLGSVARQEIRRAAAAAAWRCKASSAKDRGFPCSFRPAIRRMATAMIDAREITKKAGTDPHPGGGRQSGGAVRDLAGAALGRLRGDRGDHGGGGARAPRRGRISWCSTSICPTSTDSRCAGSCAHDRRPRRFPVLHLSATFTNSADFVQGFEAGADSYLTRPVEPPVLIATVRTLLFARHADFIRRGIDARLRTMFNLAPVGDRDAGRDAQDPERQSGLSARSAGISGRRSWSDGISMRARAFANRPPRMPVLDAHGPVLRFERKDGTSAEIEWQVAEESMTRLRILVASDVSAADCRAERARERSAGERAGRAHRGGAQQPAQGGVPRDAVARAAQSAECDPRLGDGPEPQARPAGARHSGAAGDRAQFAHPGADDLGSSRLCRASRSARCSW